MLRYLSLTLILSATILAGCERELTVVEEKPDPLCLKHTASVAWLLANGERQFVVELDIDNQIAGGCDGT